MSPRRILRYPCFDVVRGHRSGKEDVVMFDISMHDSTLVRECDTAKQVKNYSFDERKREESCPRLGERFHVTSVYRHYKALVRASRAFSRNREVVQELRAVRRSGKP